MSYDHYYAVIMAGGGGTRLWPLSRQARPKQMLRLFEQGTLFQMAVSRLEGLFAPDRIFVVTVADQAEELKRQVPAIPVENYLIEPMPRGTASVVGMAAVALQKRDPQAVMAVLTADHFIQDEARFRELLKAAYEVSMQGQLVTLGITPTFPSTGYGYIQRGEALGNFGGHPAYRVLRFREKPDEENARKMVEGGDHDWNSGMFIWRVDRIMDEFHRLMPELAEKLDAIASGWGSPRQNELVQEIWPTIKSETIDYGIMERAEGVAVLPAAELGWNDVGSWDALFDVLPLDENGNVVIGGQHLAFDTQNTLVAGSDSPRLIVTIGVKDLVVVDTGDALLICDRRLAQDVKKLVTHLKQNDGSQYL